jgi:DNA helicase-2/ATP-dependent DNA helicase PcrA
LARASFQTREFEERFLRNAIPYRIVGGLRFYERQEVKDVVSYIRFLLSDEDGLAFERIINVPKRSIGEVTIHKAHVIAAEEGCSVAVGAQRYANNVRGKASQAINRFFEVMTECRELLKITMPALVVKTLLEKTGYIDMWKKEKTTEALARLENIKELINVIADFDTLDDFVNHTSLMSEKVEPDSLDMVNLMTIHGAKGLEFNTVFLVGWEESLFPNHKTLIESGISGLEEERRLAYVALTRAKTNVFISYCSHRKTSNAGWQVAFPSRFIRELPAENVLFLDKKGVSQGGSPAKSIDISDDESEATIRNKYKFLKASQNKVDNALR